MFVRVFGGSFCLAEVVEEGIGFGDGEGGDVGRVGRIGETERGKLLALFDGDLLG